MSNIKFPSFPDGFKDSPFGEGAPVQSGGYQFQYLEKEKEKDADTRKWRKQEKKVGIWIEGEKDFQYRNKKLYDESGSEYKPQPNTFEYDVLMALTAIEHKGGSVGRRVVSTLANQEELIVEIYYQEGGAAYLGGEGEFLGGSIGFDSLVGLVNEKEEILSSAGILAHELGHGMVEYEKKTYLGEIKWWHKNGDPFYTDLEEKYVIQTYEQPISQALGTPFSRGQHRLNGKNSMVPITGGVTSNKTSKSAKEIRIIARQIQKNMINPIQTRKNGYYKELKKHGLDPNDYPGDWEGKY